MCQELQEPQEKEVEILSEEERMWAGASGSFSGQENSGTKEGSSKT